MIFSIAIKLVFQAGRLIKYCNIFKLLHKYVHIIKSYDVLSILIKQKHWLESLSIKYFAAFLQLFLSANYCIARNLYLLLTGCIAHTQTTLNTSVASRELSGKWTPAQVDESSFFATTTGWSATRVAVDCWRYGGTHRALF